MKGLVLFLGESFRLGGQHSRNRGHPQSYDSQIKASNSHIRFIKHMNINIDVYIASYTTQYSSKLLDIYKPYLIHFDMYNTCIGLNNLFFNSLKKIKSKYDFIMYIRIDIYLKKKFLDIFNINTSTILFPSICMIPHDKVDCDPRVNDVFLFIPCKYFKYIKNIKLGHETWHILMKTTDLTYADIETLVYTYHDSDSSKDYNPFYYIVNRERCKIMHSPDIIFNKYKYGKIEPLIIYTNKVVKWNFLKKFVN